MEFSQTLQELRKQKGLTQEELATALFVSRTAVSKWESGRGYPNIDSLKAIAAFFGVTVDTLLSGEELLTLAEQDGNQKESRRRDVVFGLLDVSLVLLFILPVFGQTVNGAVQTVSLLSLTAAPYLLAAYYAVTIAGVAAGLLTLSLQWCSHPLWLRVKPLLSLLLSAAAVLLFILGKQPYAAALSFVFLGVKALPALFRK